MMDRHLTPLLGSLLLVFVACQPANRGQTASETAVDTAEIRTAVQAVNTAFEDAVRAGDYEKQASLYTADAVVAPPMAPPVEGRDSVRALLERAIPAGGTVEIEERDIEPLGSDRAYVLGVTTLSFTPEGAEQEQTSELTFLALLRRTADGWQYYREVYNLNQPPPETE